MKEFSLEDFSPEDTKEQLITTLCKQKAIDISIAYISDFKSAKLLREVIDNLCKGYGIDPKWRTRLVLVIDELNNNAIEYGSKKGEKNYMSFKLSKNTSGNLIIDTTVTDTGKGDHAKKAKDMLLLRKQNENKDFSHHHSIRGRGLFFIISHLVDDLYFRDSEKGGLIVGARKTLTQKPQK
ncbi:ATP-binding protein [Candidatus Gracilibacteria bacterium]|nr:ATP-binding protein [Candidatus Gracilibacteria bacterium]